MFIRGLLKRMSRICRTSKRDCHTNIQGADCYDTDFDISAIDKGLVSMADDGSLQCPRCSFISVFMVHRVITGILSW